MVLEIKINNRIARVELIEKTGNNIKIKVDDLIYDIDFVKVKNFIYSIISEAITFNLELHSTDNGKTYIVDTNHDSYDVRVIDAQAKYLQNRDKISIEAAPKTIISPMPGKIIRIPFKEGDFIRAGQTVIIVEAMKMQSEYEVKQDCKIKKILVSEGQIINANQTLVILD